MNTRLREFIASNAINEYVDASREIKDKTVWERGSISPGIADDSRIALTYFRCLRLRKRTAFVLRCTQYDHQRRTAYPYLFVVPQEAPYRPPRILGIHYVCECLPRSPNALVYCMICTPSQQWLFRQHNRVLCSTSPVTLTSRRYSCQSQ